MEDTKILQQIGLSESECNLYLACLNMGPSSAIHLARKINLTRQMIYTLLDGLLEKGLIKKVQIENRQYYQAVSPDILVDMAQNITHKIEQLAPKLKAQQSQTATIPIITVYENIISMREWYRNYMKLAKEGEELLIWSSGKANDWYSLDKEFYDKYLKFSDDHNIQSTVLLPDTPEAQKYQEQIGSSRRKYRFVANGWQSNAEKWIWRNQVCYLTVSVDSANMIVMESKHLADLERCNFKNNWKNAII